MFPLDIVTDQSQDASQPSCDFSLLRMTRGIDHKKIQKYFVEHQRSPRRRIRD
jgi:hypothetical protein